MDFWDLTRVLFRRWYVAVPLVLLTVAASAYTWTEAEPDWKSTAYVQLIPPVFPAETDPGNGPVNPWLDLGLESLNTAAGYATQDQTFLTELAGQGNSPNVVITSGYPAPVVTIEVVGSSREQARATTDQVVERFTRTVEALQVDHGAAANSMIVTRRLDRGDNINQTGGKVKRALIAVTGAGLLLTVALTVAFDAALRRAGHRRAARGAAPSATSGRSWSALSPVLLWRPRRRPARPPPVRPPAADPVQPPGGEQAHSLTAEPVPSPEAVGTTRPAHSPVTSGFRSVPVPPEVAHGLAYPHTGAVDQAGRRLGRDDGSAESAPTATEATLVLPRSVGRIRPAGERATRH